MSAPVYFVCEDADAELVVECLHEYGYAASRLPAPGSSEAISAQITALVRRHKLSMREADVVTFHVAGGLTVSATAKELGIAPGTVKWHLRNVFAKTNANSVTEVLRMLCKIDPTR